MKKIIVIFFLLISFAASSQYRICDWKTYVYNVVTVGTDTFRFDAMPYDYNDPGAINRYIGNYFVDFVGNRYKIIDSTSTTITVKDEFATGIAPQSDQIGRVYKSVGSGAADYIGGVDITPLDELSKFKIVAADNDLFWQKIVDNSGIDSLWFNVYSGYYLGYLNGALVDSFSMDGRYVEYSDSALFMQTQWQTDTTIANVRSEMGIATTIASTVEAITGVDNEKMMTPLKSKEKDEILNVPYYGANDDIYSEYNIRGDTIRSGAVLSMEDEGNYVINSDSAKAYIDRKKSEVLDALDDSLLNIHVGELVEVAAASPQEDDVIKFNGTSWIIGTVPIPGQQSSGYINMIDEVGGGLSALYDIYQDSILRAKTIKSLTNDIAVTDGSTSIDFTFNPDSVLLTEFDSTGFKITKTQIPSVTNWTALDLVSGTNTGDNATNSQYSGIKTRYEADSAKYIEKSDTALFVQSHYQTDTAKVNIRAEFTGSVERYNQDSAKYLETTELPDFIDPADTTGLFHQNRDALDLVEGTNTGDKDTTFIYQRITELENDTTEYQEHISTDFDKDSTNEIQTISRDGLTVTLTDGGTFQDSVLTEADVDAMVADNEYLTTETLFIGDSANLIHWVDTTLTIETQHRTDSIIEDVRSEVTAATEISELPDAIAGVRDEVLMTPLKSRSASGILYVPFYLPGDDIYSLNDARFDTIYATSELMVRDTEIVELIEAYSINSFTETDPVFSAWDKSTGISITESQISDLDHFVNADETDQIYSGDSAAIKTAVREWDASIAKSISEEDTTYWGTDNVNDADYDPTNEIQLLSISHDTIFLSDGGFVKLDSTNFVWLQTYIQDYSINAEIDPTVSDLVKSISAEDTTWWGTLTAQYFTKGTGILYPTTLTDKFGIGVLPTLKFEVRDSTSGAYAARVWNKHQGGNGLLVLGGSGVSHVAFGVAQYDETPYLFTVWGDGTTTTLGRNTSGSFAIDASTTITKDGSNNMVFTDAVIGAKTLASLVSTASIWEEVATDGVALITETDELRVGTTSDLGSEKHQVSGGIALEDSEPIIRLEDTDLGAVNGQEYRLRQASAHFYIDYMNSGGTFTNALDFNSAFDITANLPFLTKASATGAAGLNIPHGTAPSSPNNGDVWTTTSGLYSYINGATVLHTNTPVDATYITQTANSTLSNEQALGALGTGILKNTTTTGVLSIALAADFPTLNQNTTGSAAKLTTARDLYGFSFDGSAGTASGVNIIGSSYGGTGSGFTKFSGAATSEKTYTLPNSSTTILTKNYTGSLTTGLLYNTTSTGDLSIASGALTTIDTEDLTTNRALISVGTGKVGVSSVVDTTELNYLNGVTSAIQTQLNAKDGHWGFAIKVDGTLKDSIYTPDLLNFTGTNGLTPSYTDATNTINYSGKNLATQSLSISAGNIAFNVASGLNGSVTLNANSTITFSNLTIGDSGQIKITQDGTGSRRITDACIGYDCEIANNSLVSSDEVLLSSTAGAKDILCYWYDGTNVNFAIIYDIK